MSKADDNREIILKRAEDICDICQQMEWRKCECGRMNYHCDQLISKFSDHDYPYMWKSEAADSGKRFHYIKIAGVKTPFETLDKYSSHVIERLKALKWVHSRYIIEEMNIGRLEEERAMLHMKVLQSIGFKVLDMDPAARMFAGALEKFVEFRARGWLKWDTDMEIGIWEHVIDRHGIDDIRKDGACPQEILDRWEKEHEKV